MAGHGLLVQGLQAGEVASLATRLPHMVFGQVVSFHEKFPPGPVSPR